MDVKCDNKGTAYYSIVGNFGEGLNCQIKNLPIIVNARTRMTHSIQIAKFTIPSGYVPFHQL